jgi:hypothetical protein
MSEAAMKGRCNEAIGSGESGQEAGWMPKDRFVESGIRRGRSITGSFGTTILEFDGVKRKRLLGRICGRELVGEFSRRGRGAGEVSGWLTLTRLPDTGKEPS